MSMPGLPTELGNEILSLLGPRELQALCLTSRYYRLLAEPHLYRRVDLFEDEDWKIQRLVFTLVGRAELLLHVRELHLHERDGSRSGHESHELNAEFAFQFHALAQRAGLYMSRRVRSQWIHDFRKVTRPSDVMFDNAFALLICATTNLAKLSIDHRYYECRVPLRHSFPNWKYTRDLVCNYLRGPHNAEDKEEIVQGPAYLDWVETLSENPTEKDQEKESGLEYGESSGLQPLQNLKALDIKAPELYNRRNIRIAKSLEILRLSELTIDDNMKETAPVQPGHRHELRVFEVRYAKFNENGFLYLLKSYAWTNLRELYLDALCSIVGTMSVSALCKPLHHHLPELVVLSLHSCLSNEEPDLVDLAAFTHLRHVELDMSALVHLGAARSEAPLWARLPLRLETAVLSFDPMHESDAYDVFEKGKHLEELWLKALQSQGRLALRKLCILYWEPIDEASDGEQGAHLFLEEHSKVMESVEAMASYKHVFQKVGIDLTVKEYWPYRLSHRFRLN